MHSLLSTALNFFPSPSLSSSRQEIISQLFLSSTGVWNLEWLSSSLLPVVSFQLIVFLLFNQGGSSIFYRYPVKGQSQSPIVLLSVLVFSPFSSLLDLSQRFIPLLSLRALLLRLFNQRIAVSYTRHFFVNRSISLVELFSQSHPSNFEFRVSLRLHYRRITTTGR